MIKKLKKQFKKELNLLTYKGRTNWYISTYAFFVASFWGGQLISGSSLFFNILVMLIYIFCYLNVVSHIFKKYRKKR